MAGAKTKKKRFTYIDSNSEGYSRVKRGKGFVVLDSKGSRVTDPIVLERVGSLAIPPNWKRVWICRHEDGHIQATGIDARRRKQYIYHTLWTEARSRVKYDLLYEFGRGLSKLEKRLERDLRRECLDLRFISALAIGIIRHTSIRPGNTHYSRSNGSYGLTNLEKEHVVPKDSRIFFRFVGKKGVLQDRCCKKKAATSSKGFAQCPAGSSYNTGTIRERKGRFAHRT